MSEAVDNLVKKEIKKYKSEKFREELIKKYEDFDLGEFEPGDLSDTNKEKEKKLDKYLKLKHIDKDTIIAYYNYKYATKNTKEELKEKFYAKINKYIDNKIKELESSKEEDNDNVDMDKKINKDLQKVFRKEINGIKIIDLIAYLKSNTNDIEKILSEIEETDELNDEEKKLITKEINGIKEVKESLVNYNIFEGSLMAKIAEKIAKKIGKKALASNAIDTIALLVYNAEKEKDEKKKAELLEKADKLQMAVFNTDGSIKNFDDASSNVRCLIDESPDLKETLEKTNEELEKLKKDDNDAYWEALTNGDERMYKNSTLKDFKEKSDEYDKHQKDRNEKAENLYKKDQNSESEEKEEKKETEVKDKNGVVWIKRKKERGEGYTYCKKDDRSVTMSQDEYKKHYKKESLNISNYLKDKLIVERFYPLDISSYLQ